MLLLSFSLGARDQSQDGCPDMVFENVQAGVGIGDHPLKTSRQKQQRICRTTGRLGDPAGFQREIKS